MENRTVEVQHEGTTLFHYCPETNVISIRRSKRVVEVHLDDYKTEIDVKRTILAKDLTKGTTLL